MRWREQFAWTPQSGEQAGLMRCGLDAKHSSVTSSTRLEHLSVCDIPLTHPTFAPATSTEGLYVKGSHEES